MLPISPPNGYTTRMNPTQLGPYEIVSRLGRGGMGAVYEAIDTTSGDRVAVKVLASHLADDPGLRSRFDAEIETLKGLRHPGIVRLLAFGEQDDQPFFAMELVRGKSLEQILRSGRRFTWQETVAISLEVTRSLKAAHDQGIVHRDLKPANLLVAEPSAGTQPGTATAADKVTVKLADFGIAKLFGGVSHTALGHVVGTAEYMAPEQAAGRPIDHRVDLYALGLVMFAMLTGSPPFRGTQLTEVIDQQRRAIPPRVASLVPAVPAELDELIARLLSKEPSQRPASALALGRLLTAIETLYASPAEAGPAATQPIPAAGNTSSPARVVTPAATAQERSKKATRPVNGLDATGPAIPPESDGPRSVPIKVAHAEIDLLAPTQPLPQPVAAPTAGRAAAPQKPSAPRSPQPQPPIRGPQQQPGSVNVTRELPPAKAGSRTAASASPSVPSRLPTDAASATTQVDRSQRNQFTTVAEVERAAAEKAQREQRWQLFWQGLTAAVIAAAVGGLAWILLKPPSADQVFERIMAVANDEHGDLRDASDEMDRFLAMHAGDPRAGRVGDLKRKLDLDLLERRARRRFRGDKASTPLERDYRAAINDEEHGPSACLKSLEAMLAVHGSATTDGGGDTKANLWLDLARRKVEQLRPLAIAEQRDDNARIGTLLADAASLKSRGDFANDEAARKVFAAQRRAIFENIVEVYAERPHAADAVAFARRELAGTDAPQRTPATSTEPDPFADPAVRAALPSGQP